MCVCCGDGECPLTLTLSSFSPFSKVRASQSSASVGQLIDRSEGHKCSDTPLVMASSSHSARKLPQRSLTYDWASRVTDWVSLSLSSSLSFSLSLSLTHSAIARTLGRPPPLTTYHLPLIHHHPTAPDHCCYCISTSTCTLVILLLLQPLLVLLLHLLLLLLLLLSSCSYFACLLLHRTSCQPEVKFYAISGNNLLYPQPTTNSTSSPDSCINSSSALLNVSHDPGVLIESRIFSCGCSFFPHQRHP